MKVSSLAGSLGSCIDDVNITNLNTKQEADIKSLLAKRYVLIFPNQPIDVATLETITKVVGTPRKIIQDGPPEFVEFPNVSVLRSNARADRWHTDLTFLEEPNPHTLLLYARGITGAGDTMWASMVEAYNTLSPRMREYLDGLVAVHTAANNGSPNDFTSHPVVHRHPDTGVRSLYVNRHYTSHIVGLPQNESRAILDFLFAHSEQVHFTCRWSWSPGDLCVWDNRVTIHTAVNDYAEDQERVIYRMSTSK